MQEYVLLKCVICQFLAYSPYLLGHFDMKSIPEHLVDTARPGYTYRSDSEHVTRIEGCTQVRGLD